MPYEASFKNAIAAGSMDKGSAGLDKDIGRRAIEPQRLFEPKAEVQIRLAPSQAP
jgi:hypothetical protein